MNRIDKTNIIKNNLISALEKSLGVVTEACKMASVSRATFYDYMGKDPNFAEKVNEIQNVALDFVESKLFEEIEKGNITGIIFYLKTKGKSRGYIEPKREDLKINNNILAVKDLESIKKISFVDNTIDEDEIENYEELK